MLRFVHAIIAAFLVAGPAAASTLALQSFEADGGIVCNSYNGNNCGYAFTTDSGLLVTAIGAFDRGADGFADTAVTGSSAVTLYDFDTREVLAIATAASSSRLAGANVTGGSAGDYRMMDLPTPVSLLAGKRYLIAAFGTFAPIPELGTLASNGISSIRGYETSGTGFPGFSDPFTFRGLLAANFEYETTVIPLPASLPLLGAALVGLFGLRRRG